MTVVNVVRLLGAAALALGVSACATNSPENAALGIKDPYEELNRDIHAFNKGADRYALRPVSQGYRTVTPDFFRLFVSNALNHLELPRDFANHVLSGELGAAGRTVLRFTVNTTIGAAGLMDPASEFDLEKEDADFGQTLATWGFGSGIYYEIPLLGPSTVRHSTGRFVDIAFAPSTYIGDFFVSAGINAVDFIDFRTTNFGTVDNALYESIDSYVTVRNAYLRDRGVLTGGADELDEIDALDVEPQ